MNVTCDNCNWKGTEEELGRGLVEIHKLASRLDPGGLVPAGECPECNCFAYPHSSYEERAAFDEERRAFKELRRDYLDLMHILGSAHVLRCSGCSRWILEKEQCPHCNNLPIHDTWGRR